MSGKMTGKIDPSALPVPPIRPGGIGPGCILHDTYRVRHRIAEGGMATLYLATHERLPGLFVIKTPHAHLAHDPMLTARLRQEAEALAGLDHPNIVRVFDFNETPTGTPYLVMEFLDGRDLNSIIRARRLAPWEVASIVRQIAAALGAAHTRGVVHRDLKPENILVIPGAGEGEDVIKLIDFGVSKVEHAPRVQSGVGLLGTPHYMAPEQAHGKSGMVDPRTDQFALAVMTYEMLMRETPFGGDDPLTVLYRIVHEETPPVVLKDGAEQSWTPRAVQDTLLRALAKDPAERFANVDEFARALTDAIAADFGGPPAPLCLFQRADTEPRAAGSTRLTPEPAPTPAPRATSAPTSPSSRQRRGRTGAAVLVATAAAAGALFYFRADVERALPPAARAELGAVIGRIAPTTRMLPSMSWGVRVAAPTTTAEEAAAP